MVAEPRPPRCREAHVLQYTSPPGALRPRTRFGELRDLGRCVAQVLTYVQYASHLRALRPRTRFQRNICGVGAGLMYRSYTSPGAALHLPHPSGGTKFGVLRNPARGV